MSAVQTPIFVSTPSVPHQNACVPQPGTISTGAALTYSFDTVAPLDDVYVTEVKSYDLFGERAGEATTLEYPAEWFGQELEGWEQVTVGMGATGESCEYRPVHFNQYGYYVVVDQTPTIFEGEWSLDEAMPENWAQPEFLVYGIVLAQAKVHVDLLQTQREERKATAELGKRVQALLPDFSESDLAHLVGVSRITWRGWTGGTTSARRTSRQRLLRLERILELRRRTDPGTPLTHWLDAPVGSDVQLTPARLLADGRDQIVAFLAIHVPVPAADDPRLEDVPPILNDLLNLARVDEQLAWRRELLAYEEETDDA